MKYSHQMHWPALPYSEFYSTSYLLHRIVQIMGKMKLSTPFEPHWANVALWLTSRGITTGVIPFQFGAFSIDLDLIDHKIIFTTNQGSTKTLDLNSNAVSDYYFSISSILRSLKINFSINPMPQEVNNPIAFDQDHAIKNYDPLLATAWWQILMNSYLIMQQHHARFDGESPPVGLMWGTFDLRDARYNGVHVPTTGINSSYIRRNAMNEAQVEIGWWPGNEAYPQPAFYSFTHPQPIDIEKSIIEPQAAHWDATLLQFILNYDELRQLEQPEKNLLLFFETTYAAGAHLAGWKKTLITDGVPV